MQLTGDNCKMIPEPVEMPRSKSVELGLLSSVEVTVCMCLCTEKYYSQSL